MCHTQQQFLSIYSRLHVSAVVAKHVAVNKLEENEYYVRPIRVFTCDVFAPTGTSHVEQELAFAVSEKLRLPNTVRVDCFRD